MSTRTTSQCIRDDGSSQDESGDDRDFSRTTPEYARAYVAQGLPPQPANMHTKRPAECGWRKKFSLDANRVEDQFDRQIDRLGGKAGVLIGTGFEQRPGLYLLVVDIDPRHGGLESVKKLLRDLGIKRFPRTPTARTGGGGWHVLLLAPFPATSRPLDKAAYPGIDIKSWGGYVIVAPSIHPTTGKPYRWIKGRAPWEVRIARAPKAFEALLKPRAQDQPGCRRKAQDRADDEPAGEIPTRPRKAPRPAYRPVAGRTGDPKGPGRPEPRAVRRGRRGAA